MNYGYYFKLRHNHDFLKGHILFSYTGIISHKRDLHPLFLDFNNEQIDFYFHGQIEKKGEKNRPEFIETRLFTLDLHKGRENVLKLDEFLKKLYISKFPLVENAVIYKGENKRYKGENKQHKYHTTYGDLEVFKSKGKENKGKNRNTTTENKNDGDETGKKIIYKTLILDFLFDVYHSNVFENSPAFKQIKQHLDEIPFIQAVKRKAEFYYQVENIKTKEGDKKPVTFDVTDLYYINKLIKAQKNWLEILQDKESYQVINEENRWFEDVETEVRNVLKEQIIVKLQSSEIQILAKSDRKKESPFEQLVNQKETSTQWFIKRNNIIDAWKSAFDIYKLNIKIDYFKLLGKILPAFFLFEIINIIINIEDKAFIPFDLKWWFLVTLLSIFIVLTPILIYLSDLKKRNKKRFKFNHLVRLFYYLALIPFFILVLTSSFVISEFTSFDNHYFVLINDLNVKYGILLVLLIFIVAIFMLYIRKEIEYLQNIKPRSYIILSFIFVSIVFFVIFRFIFWIEVPVFILGLIIFWLLYNDERKNYPKLSSLTSMDKIFSMLIVGLAFSFFSNLLVLHFTYKDYLDKFSFVDELWKSALYPKESSFDATFRFDTSNVPHEELEKIKAVLKMPVSSKKMAEKEEYFYTPLEKLKIYKNKQEIYPVVKTLHIHGLKIITMPMVLFVNTFLTLLLAVLVQIVLNHRKFLEGGKA